MLLIGESTMPDKTFRPDTRTILDRASDDVLAMAEAYHAADQLMRLRDNSTADHEARSDAFDRRAARIRELTGKEIENPYRLGPVISTSPEGLTRHDWQPRFDAWNAEVAKLADGVGDDMPARRELHAMLRTAIDRDAQAITRQAQAFSDDAARRSDARGVPGLLTGYAGFMGSMRGMFRDPLQVATLGIGGPEGLAAKTITGRILARALTEAAINGGVEMAVQRKAEQWREQAGVPIGWDGMWSQVGLAAVFGGGMGGLLQGGGEVIKALGRATPEAEAAFSRVVAGDGSAEDLKIVSEAVNVPVPEEDLKAFSRALDEDAATAATVGASADPRAVAEAVQAIEQGGTVPQVPAEPPPGAIQLRQFRVSDLNTDPARFQFKDGGDAEGVTAALRGVKEWIPERADPLIVFEDLNGKVFVGDGHQRSGLARRIEAETGQPITLNAYVFRAADGFTEADVRVRAALKNIGQGSGTAIDAAKVLRTGKISDPKAAGLPPNGAIVRDGVALARLSDDAFTMAVNEVVDPKLAAVVGRLVDDPRLHAQMLDALKTADARTIPEAESMVRDMLAEPQITGTQSSLFGEEDFARMLLKEKAAVRAATLSALRKDRAVFNRLVEEQSRIAEAGNVLDTAANAQRVQSDAILIEAIDRLSRQVGPVADALNDAARAVAGGERASAAAKGFAENVRSAIAAGGGRLDRVGEQPRLIDPSVSGTHAIEPGTPESADAAQNALRAMGGDAPETAAALEAAGQANMFGASEATPIEAGQLVASQPEIDLDVLYGGQLQANQGKLAEAGDAIAAATGVKFKNPGIKKRETAAEKITRKGYRSLKQLTDLVRGGFVVDTPQQADQVVALLGERFSIIDEGWAVNPVGYADRKVLVQFADGTVGEVQLWEKQMLAAKNAGGHNLYDQSRSLKAGDPQRLSLEDAQRALYEPVLAALPDDWRAALGSSGMPGNRVANASADTTRPLSMTSARSTSDQPSPGARIDQARPAANTAGRYSQSSNVKDFSISSQDSGSSAKMQTGSEATPAGQQILIPGVAEITVRDLVNAADKPMRGGDKPPPAGGLFDDAARDQIDLLDAIPAGADAEGKPLITTHAELRAQGDRVDYLADVISSCKE